MPRDAPPALSPLLVGLWRVLTAPRPAVGRARCFARLRALVAGALLAAPRPTVAPAPAAHPGPAGRRGGAFYHLLGRERLGDDALTRCYPRQTLAHRLASAIFCEPCAMGRNRRQFYIKCGKIRVPNRRSFLLAGARAPAYPRPFRPVGETGYAYL